MTNLRHLRKQRARARAAKYAVDEDDDDDDAFTLHTFMNHTKNQPRSNFIPIFHFHIYFSLVGIFTQIYSSSVLPTFYLYCSYNYYTFFVLDDAVLSRAQPKIFNRSDDAHAYRNEL